MKQKVGINGFGRIGRLVVRAFFEGYYENLQLVAINSRGDPETDLHMFKYDSTYGIFEGDVKAGSNSIYVNGQELINLSHEEPKDIPWDENDVDIVIECTGKFTDAKSAGEHLNNGAKKVIISAPSKNEDITMVMGVNHTDYIPSKHHIISNASCTTNCVAPLIKVLEDNFGLQSAMMTTIHSYTNDQQILDKRHKDKRRARAAATNIIPTTTGAAKAVGTVIPKLKNRINGMAVRVPTPTVSLTDVVATLTKKVTPDDINHAYQRASTSYLRGILGLSMDPLVSSDYKKNSFSCVIDGLSTMTLGDNMVKVIGWYDNEWGYSVRTVEMANYMASRDMR